MAEQQREFHDLESLVGQVTERALEILDEAGRNPTILIDGRAGAGKSTLAERLQDALFRAGEPAPRIIHMDELYPGWTGLAIGSQLAGRILEKRAAGETASWQAWDWNLGQRGKYREFAGGTSLIIEGCGSLNRESATRADIRIWLEVDDQTRHERWLERDGTRFDKYWATWAAQELDFYSREKSSELADFLFRHQVLRPTTKDATMKKPAIK